jgi:hypothetical protein
VNLASVQAQNASIRNNVITWNGSQNSNFASLTPQASGNLALQFQLNNPATKDSTKNLQVGVNFQITSQEYPQGFQLQTPTQKIQTQLSLLASAAPSSGANPPMVGKTSTYVMTYTIHNASNDVTAGSFAVALPQAVGFDMTSVNADQAANVKYNSSTHILTWTIANVPAYAGVFLAAPKLQFSETIEPSITDTGSNVDLSQNAMFSGTDSYTSQQITAGAQDLTTNDAGVSGVVGAQ